MPKAKLRHDDHLRVICIMCCGKLGRDQRGIGKDMEAFIQNISQLFSASTCVTYSVLLQGCDYLYDFHVALNIYL